MSYCRSLDWKRKLLSLHNLGIVNPEEITVQHRLQHTGHNSQPLHSSFSRVPPNPVWNIQRTVCSQRSDIVHGNCIRLSSPLQHEQLWQNSDRFQPDRESPWELEECVFVRRQDGHDGGESEEVWHAEGVKWRGGGRTICRRHLVEGVAGGGEEEELEDGVIIVDVEGGEDIEVAGYVDEEVEGLGFEGYAGAGLSEG